MLFRSAYRKGAGIVGKKDFFADYRNSMVNTLAQNFQGLKVVVDVGNGAASLSVPMVLKALHCDLDLMNGEPDGSFPGRGADSSSPEALETLGEKVRKTRSQLGAAFDGDGDRISLVDEKGREMPNEALLCGFADEFLKRNTNASVVYDGKCSDWVDQRVREAGGTPILEKSGYAHIFNRMQVEKALLGGEASGHFFLPGPFPGDPLYAFLRLLEILKESRKTLSQFCHAFPPRVSTHDLKIKCSPQGTQPLFAALKARALELGAKVSELDGIRAVFGEGWGIVRLSATEPFLSCRFEAPNRSLLTKLIEDWFRDFKDLKEEFLKRLP